MGLIYSGRIPKPVHVVISIRFKTDLFDYMDFRNHNTMVLQDRWIYNSPMSILISASNIWSSMRRATPRFSRFFKHAKKIMKCVPFLFAQNKNRVQFEACKNVPSTRRLDSRSSLRGVKKVGPLTDKPACRVLNVLLVMSLQLEFFVHLT